MRGAELCDQSLNIRSVRNDPDLKHSEYEGEYVVSAAVLYRILPDGNVEEVGATGSLFGRGLREGGE